MPVRLSGRTRQHSADQRLGRQQFWGDQRHRRASDRYRTMQGADAPTRDEKIVVGVDASGNVSGELWNGSSWSALPLSMGTVSETYWYGAEVAYEQQSGDAVVVWNDNSQPAGDKLRFAVWDGASWTAPQSIGLYTGVEPQNLRLAFDPGSDALALVISDVNADDHVMIWNGGSWGNAITLDTTGTAESDQSAIAVSFEAQGGNALVTYGINGSADVYYRIWDGSSWSTQASVPAAAGVTGDAAWLVTATDYTTDRIALATMSGAGEVWLNVWDGSAWDTSVLAETGTTGTVYPNLAVAFESSTGQALAVYGESGSSIVKYRTWDAAGGWSAELSGPNLGAVPNSMTLDSGPTGDHIMLSVQDANNDLHYVLWNGSSWESTNTLSTNTGEIKNQPFAFIYDQDGLLVEPNAAPVNTVPATQNTAIDTPLVFGTANGNLISVADTDDGSVEVTLTATNGTLTLNGTTGLAFSNGDGSADPTMTFSGTLADVNAALDGLQFDPTAAFEGFATLQITTTDFAAGGGSPKTDIDAVTIEVGDVNTAPVNSVPSTLTLDPIVQNGMLLFSSARGTAITISDADTGSAAVQVTLAATNGTLNLQSTQGLTFGTGDGTADATMTFTGTVADINAALEGMTFVATTNFVGTANVQITTDDLGNSGAGGAQSDTDSVDITVQAPNNALWLTTQDDSTATGAPGLDNWTAGTVLNFGASLTLEPGTTSGTFSAVSNYDGFGDGDVRVDGVHYVSRDMTVGTNNVQLYAGDLLLSVQGAETIGGLSVDDKDIFVFRPTEPGDYSAGTMTLLLDGSDIGIGNLTAFTLVEHDTTVGDVTLSAGEFLLAHNGSTKNIFRFAPGTLGATSSGSPSMLLNAGDIDIGQEIYALDLVERDITLGDTTLTVANSWSR